MDKFVSNLSKIDQKLHYFFSTNVQQSQEVANRVPILYLQFEKKKYEGMYFSLDEIQNFFNAMSVS